jgi:RHS repeat-associated protein
MLSHIRRALFISALGFLATTSQASDFGRTTGSFAVSPSGASTYTIPIWTPPGPNGIQPSIALSYNSQAGNGLAGVGWNLAAVSSIERCGPTYQQDGYGAPVDLSVNDRFCFGGNKLRVITGTYGSANSVYYTEFADYSRITAYGTAGSGPQYFTVEDKNGLKYEYGNSTSSRVLLGGSTVLRWMLNKVYDRNGNNYVVSYNNTTGFAVPDVISWTPVSYGSTSYRYDAKFNYYTTRSDEDSILGKVAGNDVANRYRLQNIQIKSAGVVKRKYTLVYETAPYTLRSRLHTVTECGDDAESNCFLPITLGYQAGQYGVNSTAAAAISSTSSLVAGKYDFNGDGKSDLLYVVSGTWRVAFSTGSGFSAPVDTGVASTATYLVQRFLANHQDGLLVNASSSWTYVGYNGSTFVSTPTGIPAAATTVVTDNNGDGISDLLWTSSGSVMVRLNTTTGGAAVPAFGSPFTAASFTVGQGNVAIINAQNCPVERKCDINGDGRSDFTVNVTSVTGCGMAGCTITNTLYDLISTGNGVYTAASPTGPIGYTGIMFNSDRCIDRIPNNSLNMLVSGCNSGTPTTVALPAAPALTMDWDGDGRGDVLVNNNNGYFGAYLSHGNTAAPLSAVVPTTVPFSSSCTYFVFDVDGDGLDDIGCVANTSPFSVSYYTHNGAGGTFLTQEPDLLNSIVDGFGISIAPSYVSTAQGSYTRGTGTQLPLVDATEPITVVAQVSMSDGVGSGHLKTYSYSGARINPSRGEYAGFARMDEVDSRTGIVSRTYFEQTFPVTGMVSQTEVMQPNGVTTISRNVVTNSFSTLDSTANNQRYYTYPSGSTFTQYEVGGILNANLLRTVVTTDTYDPVTGLLYDHWVVTTEPASGANGVNGGGSWTQRTYSPLENFWTDDANWCRGRPYLTYQVGWSNLTYGAQINRTYYLDVDTVKCRLTRLRDYTSDTGNTLQVTADYGYDSFGNENSVSVTGAGMSARTTTTTWSDGTNTTGQFPLSVTNALNQTSTSAWNYDLGLQLSNTDANGISTSWQYDDFGRRKRESRPDGTATTWTYNNCATYQGGCVSSLNKTLIVETQLDSGGSYINDVWTYLDQLDRPLNSTTRTFGGTYSFVATDYNALGNVARQTTPCWWGGGCSSAWATTYWYDILGRVTSISNPKADYDPTLKTSFIYYEGLTTRTYDELSKASYKISNAVGQLARSQDHDGNYQNFDYDGFGNVMRVQDNAGNTLQSSTYNLRGMLTQRTDMDMGTWTYDPDALGEVIHVRDAKTSAPAWTQTLGYDLLGRLTSRSEAEGTSTFTFGTSGASKNIGRLASMSGPGYSETYFYDAAGRPSTTSISADTTYQIDYAYNSLGSLDSLTYPTSTASYRLKLKYDYQYGYLKQIKDFNAPTTVFWTQNSASMWNKTYQETLGNGLVMIHDYDGANGRLKTITSGVGGGSAVQNFAYNWDLVGNLWRRLDYNQATLTEEFFYDNLYRLDYSRLNGVQNLNVDYDGLGNITNKSDVGTYTYDSAKRHQVRSTSNGWSFDYDANGNMLHGRNATYTWTSYNYPASITNGSDSSSFSYTPSRQYWRQISNYTSGGAATTIYVGGILEKVTTSSGTDYRHMIRAGNAEIIVSRKTAGTDSVTYVTSDSLGSSSAVTNASGGVLMNSSFDAFGKRRGSNWSGSPSSGDWTAIAATTRRGYTDHTMLDNLSLVHMNGRVQDPILGRFVSADPTISQPNNTQNYNRYSYVDNNPLSATDPTGFKKNLNKKPARQNNDRGEARRTSGSKQWDFETNYGRAMNVSCSGDCGANQFRMSGDTHYYDRAGISQFIWVRAVDEGLTFPNDGTSVTNLYQVYVGRDLIGNYNPGRDTMHYSDLGKPSAGLERLLFDRLAGFGARVRGSAISTLNDVAENGLYMAAAELGGVAIGALAKGGSEALNALREVKVFCFPKGTTIETPTGQRKIEEIKVGDSVISFDLQRNQPVVRTVTALIRKKTVHWYVISMGSDEIKVTGAHPFWVANEKRWVHARDLQPGFTLEQRDGSTVKITAVRLEELNQPETTYNFEVQKDHNYFAGTEQHTVLVHNTDPFDILFSRDPRLIEATDTFAHGPWAGRTLGDAVLETRSLGMLPDGLSLNASWVNDVVMVTANNRTLWVAQQAGLNSLSVSGLDSGRVAKTVMEHLAESGGPFCAP